MIKKYTILFFVTVGIACTIKNVKSEKLACTIVTEEKSVAKTITRNKDISAALKYLALYRGRLDIIVNGVEQFSSQVTPEQDGQEAIKQADNIIVDCINKFWGADEIELPDNINQDLFEALTQCQKNSNEDLVANPVIGARDYVDYLKRNYTAIFTAAVTVLDQHYELTDEAIAPYVHPFETQKIVSVKKVVKQK